MRKVLKEDFALTTEAVYLHPNTIEKRSVVLSKEKVKNREFLAVKNVLLQVGDRKNKNNRVYLWEELTKAVIAYINNKVNHEVSYGEFGHTDIDIVNLERVSHIIKNIKFDNSSKRIYGDIVILDFLPYGNMLKNYIERDFIVGISSRALGDIEEKKSDGDKYIEVKNIEIVCWDIVCTPSVHGAYLSDVMLEGENVTYKKSIFDGFSGFEIKK